MTFDEKKDVCDQFAAVQDQRKYELEATYRDRSVKKFRRVYKYLGGTRYKSWKFYRENDLLSDEIVALRIVRDLGYLDKWLWIYKSLMNYRINLDFANKIYLAVQGIGDCECHEVSGYVKSYNGYHVYCFSGIRVTNQPAIRNLAKAYRAMCSDNQLSSFEDFLKYDGLHLVWADNKRYTIRIKFVDDDQFYRYIVTVNDGRKYVMFTPTLGISLR